MVKLEFIDFNGEKETLLRCDRTRAVNYNGNELRMNSYCCSSCNKHYKFEVVGHNYCPFCGTKYKFIDDLSV